MKNINNETTYFCSELYSARIEYEKKLSEIYNKVLTFDKENPSEKIGSDIFLVCDVNLHRNLIRAIENNK